jgi:hypothetical protein
MDACWRIFGYQTYPASTPTVLTIKVKSEKDILELQSDGKLCDLAVYFNRPVDNHQFDNLKYTEFFKTWDYSFKIPKRFKNTVSNADLDGNLFSTNAIVTKKVYIFKRLKPKINIVRMGMLYISAGEMWYLRLLLLNIAADSFYKIKNVNGIEYSTFQLAAVAAKLVEHNNEGEISFKDAIQIGSTPYQLRTMFISLTLNGFATISIYLDDFMREKMSEDFLFNNQGNKVLSRNHLLEFFSKRFRQENKENSQFGIPEPDDANTELEIEKLKYDPQQQKNLYEQLILKTPPTDEQLYLINDIKYCLANNINKIYVVQGQGGSGKTATAQLITAYARSLGYLVVGCASTAFAASIYKDFYTAHGLFEIPVIEDNEECEQEIDFRCILDKKPQRYELLMNVRIIIWDEISSQNFRDFFAAYKAMHKFKHCILIIQGDKKQIAPVIERGTRQQIVDSSIYCSDLIKPFQKINFTTNLRLIGNQEAAQISYAQLLLEIANGTHFKYNNEIINTVTELSPNGDDILSGSTRIGLHSIGLFTSIEKCIFWLYPNGFDPLNMHKTCILAVTNKQTQEWNAFIQNLNENSSQTLMSYDSFNEVDDPHDFLKNMVTEHVMNKFNDNQAPQHELVLKIDDICILLANVDKEVGLTKNTRVRIVQINTRFVRVVTLSDTHPVFANIPRFNFHIKIPFYKSYKILRRQFPLKLAYALTMNRSQGQEFEKLLVDLTVPPFTHGHLYVALSRIRKSENIKIFCNEDQVLDNNVVITNNVVYNEILEDF